jgi:hypothetical protein
MSAGGADWARLFRIACALIRQVNSEQIIIDSWPLGGGTAMMLQIDHRESHDIDIFRTRSCSPFSIQSCTISSSKFRLRSTRGTELASSNWPSTASGRSISSSGRS